MRVRRHSRRRRRRQPHRRRLSATLAVYTIGTHFDIILNCVQCVVGAKEFNVGISAHAELIKKKFACLHRKRNLCYFSLFRRENPSNRIVFSFVCSVGVFKFCDLVFICFLEFFFCCCQNWKPYAYITLSKQKWTQTRNMAIVVTTPQRDSVWNCFLSKTANEKQPTHRVSPRAK